MNQLRIPICVFHSLLLAALLLSCANGSLFAEDSTAASSSVSPKTEQQINRERLQRAKAALDRWEYETAKREAEAVLNQMPSLADAGEAHHIILTADEEQRGWLGVPAAFGKQKFFAWATIVVVGVALIIAVRLYRKRYWRKDWTENHRLYVGAIMDKTELELKSKLHVLLTTPSTSPYQLTNAYFFAQGYLAPLDAAKEPTSIQELITEAKMVLPNLPEIGAGISKILTAGYAIWRRDAPQIQVVALALEQQFVFRFTFVNLRKAEIDHTFCCSRDIGSETLDVFLQDCGYAFLAMIRPQESAMGHSWGALPYLRMATNYLIGDPHIPTTANPKKALEILSAATVTYPTNLDVAVLEAITLGVMQETDQALQLLRTIRAQVAGFVSLFFRNFEPAIADYNLAVALLRTYRPKHLEEAEQILSDRILSLHQTAPKMRPAGLALLCQAILADVLAHEIIFWRPSHEERKAIKKEMERIAEEQRANVQAKKEHALREAHSVIKASNQSDGADQPVDAMVRQARWLAYNAEGNTELNFAHSFLESLKGGKVSDGYRESLNRAEQAFSWCRDNGVPNVETYANLAAVNLFKGEFEFCRMLCELGIKCSPNYEYAYYRMAASYAAENRWADVRKTVERFKGEPKIGGFITLIENSKEKGKRGESNGGT